MFLRKSITRPSLPAFSLFSLLLTSTLGPWLVQADDVLTTDGFATCIQSDSLIINKMHVAYDKVANKVAFDVGGISLKEQKVRAELTVTAYGKTVYQRNFNPCDEGIKLLCPVPQGSFEANDTLPIPEQYASMIPQIAFEVPDLDGVAKLQLFSLDSNQTLACLQSAVVNGKTATHPAVSYVTVGIAGAALAVSVFSALGGAGGAGGAGSASPNFGDVICWFQSIATNGMLSVNYPPVYRSFAKNFAWSTGLLSWTQMQKSIDTFRAATGGNVTDMSIEYLMNSTIVSTPNGTEVVSNNAKRSFGGSLFPRQVSFSPNSTATPSSNAKSSVTHYVNGIESFVENLKIPSANTFLTVLLIFCIVVAGVAVCILLFKVILEIWALFASFPKRLTGFRKRYWSFLATTIVRIILVLYGTWTLYCLYQFKRGDSWAAHLLAGLTLAIFTVVLGFFVVRIFLIARKIKQAEGGTEALFQNKPYMRRYGLFYDQFKSNFWWIFIPMITYAFAKAAFIALGDGHGLIQAAGQLGCEAVLLVLLLWNRPFNTRSGNVLNIIISVVRVLSLLCLIVFAYELEIAADAKTVTGVVLIAIQSTLTAGLAILLVINAIVIMCKENPHDKRRKELEKQRDPDNLTPLDPRNSLLLRGNISNFGNGPDGKGHYHQTPTTDYFPVEEGGASGYAMSPLNSRHSRHGSFGMLYKDHTRSGSATSMAKESLMQSMVPPANGPRPYQYEEYRGSPGHPRAY